MNRIRLIKIIAKILRLNIIVIDTDCPDCGTTMKQGTDIVLDYDGNDIELNVYSCPDCGHIVY